MAFNDRDRETRNTNYLSVIARLKPRVSLAQAQAAVTTLAQQFAAAYPDTNAQNGLKTSTVTPAADACVTPLVPILFPWPLLARPAAAPPPVSVDASRATLLNFEREQKGGVPAGWRGGPSDMMAFFARCRAQE